jgi:hypothetical protein
MAGNEGSTAVPATVKVAGPMEWGRARRLAAALLVAFSMVSAVSVVFADTTAAQTESDAVLQWLPEIQAAASATGVPGEVIAAVIRVESGGDPNAVSVAGAIGLMQVMPAEFQSQGIPEGSWYDPATNILAGSTEIGRFLASTGSIEQALASYFGSGCDAVGTCTDGYISTVMSYAAAYATAIATGTAVDLSGVSVSTGGGTTTDAGTVDDGTSDDGSWQGGPPTDNGGWQGEPPADGDWQGGPGGDPDWDGPDETGGETGDGDTDSETGGDDTIGDGEATPIDEGEAVG